MNRIVSLVSALIVLVVILAFHAPLRLFFDPYSLLLVCLFPLLLLNAVYSPGQVWRAVGDLGAPPEAGLAARRLRENAEVFVAFGVLSLGTGAIAAIVGLIQLLGALSNPAAIGPHVALSMISLFYAFLILLFVAFPGATIHEEAARQASLLEEEQDEERETMI